MGELFEALGRPGAQERVATDPALHSEPSEKVAPTVSRVSTETFLRASERLREGPSISYRLAYNAFYRDEAWDDEPLPRRERQSNEITLRLP